MARVTVEDCLTYIGNRFELALTATYRARQLANGATPHIDMTGMAKEKPTVTALREISEGKVGIELLHSQINNPKKI